MTQKIDLTVDTQSVGVRPSTRIIAVASGKGGVGKSTVAVHIALALAQQGLKVGLLDADIHGPSLPHLLGCDQKQTVSEGIVYPLEVCGLKVASRGFLSHADAASLWRGPMAQKFLLSLLTGVAWGDLDVLILDLPPGTGDIPITLCQKVPLFGAIVVSTPQELALLDVRKTISLFETLNVPILGLIENMSYFSCESCHFDSSFFHRGLVKQEAHSKGYDFLGEVPWLRSLSERPKKETLCEDMALVSQQVFASIAHHIRDKMV